MDPNIFNIEGLPDVNELEKMANDFFRSIHHNEFPAQNGANVQRSSLTENDDINNSISENIVFGQTFIPKAEAVSGQSPSTVEQNRSFNISEPQTSLPDPHFAGEGKIPRSVAGSGKSPSYVEKSKVTNLQDNPFSQIGLSSNIFSGSGLSSSVVNHSEAGSGYFSVLEKGSNIQPIANEKSVKNSLGNPYTIGYSPYAAQLPFENEMKEILGSIVPSHFTPQLPGIQSVIGESGFYFLSNYINTPFAKDARVLSNSLDEKGKVEGIPKMPFDVNLLKLDFPILQERINGKQIIWLDNAATTQKPKEVIDRVSHFYEHENSNIHRAAHELAARATDAYELARKKVQQFLNASSPNEIVFVRGATEAINLVAKSWGDQNLKEGDEIIISHLEHHANIVPWQQLSASKGIRIKVIPVDDDGQVLLDEYAKLLTTKTKLVSFTQVSNALGTVTPAKQITAMAHQVGAKVLVDGAQTVSHMRADVRNLDCDWYVFSGHKVFGPTGIGVLFGKEELLNETQPWQGGGNMIKEVTFEKTTYHNAPGRFEAGTGNIADAVGLGAAIDYVSRIGMDLISQYEHYLLIYATKLLDQIPGLRIIGRAAEKAGVISFVMKGYKTEQIGEILNQHGIAVRSGHHCAQPILRRFGVESSVRPSLALYNTCSDIDALVSVLQRLSKS